MQTNKTIIISALHIYIQQKVTCLPRILCRFLCVSITSLLVSCSVKNNTAINMPPAYVAPNVSYSSILALPFEQADKTVFYGDDPLQFGKLWLPNHSLIDSQKNNLMNKSKQPGLVIFIHGGCWLNAFSIEHSYPLTSALAAQGNMVWSIEYRRTGDAGGGWPGTFHDVLAGIDYILNQTHFKFDKSKVFLVGHSAGGHLALLAQSVLMAKSAQPNMTEKVIGLAAISDLKQYAVGGNSCQSAVAGFMGGEPSELIDDYSTANPSEQLNTNEKLTTLIHGTGDSIVPIRQSSNANFNAKFVAVENAGHFDWLHPDSEAFKVLLEQIKLSGQ